MARKLRGFVFNVIGNSGIEIKLTAKMVDACAHQGDCEADVQYWVNELRPYLDTIPADLIARILKGYGSWDAEELADHEMNLIRLLWIAAGDAKDQFTQPEWNIRRRWLWVYMDAS